MLNTVSSQIAKKLHTLASYRMSAAHGFSYGGFHHAGGGHQAGGAKFADGLSGDGAGFSLDHRRLRQNARSAYHENLIARSLVDRYVETVADVGLVWESTPNADILKISQEEAENWAAYAEQKFDLWARDKAAHRSGNMNFYQSQRLYVIGQQRDGENFVRFYYSSDLNLQNPLQFEFIDPEQLIGDSYSTTRGYFSVKDGIQKDAQGRETGYEIRIKKQNRYEKVIIPAWSRNGRVMMIHGFAPEYPGQTRGYSRISHALQEFQNLTDFSLAQIMKAINQSQVWMFNKPSADAPASDAFEDIDKITAGPVSSAYGSRPVPPAEAENVTKESLAPINYYRPPREAFQTPGSTAVMSLAAGEEMKPFVNTAPADSYDKFVDSFAAYLSASSGVPFEVMMLRFSKNYSAMRGALILFWRICTIQQNEMSTDYLDVAVMSWMSEEIAAGRIIAPGWADPRLRAAWLSGNWHGASMPNIDPVKTSRADVIDAHELNSKTLKRIARERNGSDIRRNQAQLTREFEAFPESPLKKKVNAA
jgi:capsid protein